MFCPDCYVLEETDACLACQRRDSASRRWDTQAKPCSRCGHKVLWRSEGGKSVAIDIEGRHHACDPEEKLNVTELKTYAEIQTELRAPIERRHVQTKRQGGATIAFVSWANIANYLDHRAPGWEWEVGQPTFSDSRIFLVGTLTLVGSDGRVARAASGTEKLTKESFGDPITTAEAQAFRRAACKHGFCREMWVGDHQPNVRS